jgi:hypothetical protein
MPAGRGRPFAYSVDKLAFVFAVRPTLALAIESARDRFDPPSAVLDIKAWFADGSSETIPYELMCTPDQSAWISADQARELEERLDPAGAGAA